MGRFVQLIHGPWLCIRRCCSVSATGALYFSHAYCLLDNPTTLPLWFSAYPSLFHVGGTVEPQSMSRPLGLGLLSVPKNRGAQGVGAGTGNYAQGAQGVGTGTGFAEGTRASGSGGALHLEFPPPPPPAPRGHGAEFLAGRTLSIYLNPQTSEAHSPPLSR